MFIVSNTGRLKKTNLTTGNLARLNPVFKNHFKEISIEDQLRIINVSGDFADVSFISTTTNAAYKKTLPKKAIVKICKPSYSSFASFSLKINSRLAYYLLFNIIIGRASGGSKL